MRTLVHRSTGNNRSLKMLKMESESEEDRSFTNLISNSHENNIYALELNNHLRSLRACYNLLRKNGALLQQKLSDIEKSSQNNENLSNDINVLSECATVFGISAQAMLSSCQKYLNSAENDGHRVMTMLQQERNHAKELEKMVKEVAQQHSRLEKNTTIMFKDGVANQTFIYPEDEEKEEESEVDTLILEEEDQQLAEVDSLLMIRKSIKSQKLKSIKKSLSHLRKFENKEPSVIDIANSAKKTRIRRTRIPDRPNVAMNAWSIMKNSIGKDLSKIPLPVNFNEPLSMLQRVTEEMEYSELLDEAANLNDICEQLAYVAAFSTSAYSTTASRLGKPFNPLLYETFECDRMEDFGWRSISEQVSHHPPVSAFYCEGRGWTCWQEFSYKTKFKGKNLQVVPTGSAYCKFHNTGNTYSWGKVDSIVNNIIVGKMWMDNQGEVELKGIDAAAGARCTLSYIPFSIFSRERQRRVNGAVFDGKDVKKFIIRAFWDEKFEISKATEGAENFKTIWQRRIPEPESEKYYNFSRFTCELNEMEDGVAPTDSRLRPDLRLMEQGLWDESNCEKLRLEQKQRGNNAESQRGSSRKSSLLDNHQPLWFQRKQEDGIVVHNFKGEYWEAKEKQDWSRCPNIF